MSQRFLTSYRKHYPKKEIPPYFRPKTNQEFYDPLTKAFEEELTLQTDEAEEIKTLKNDKPKAGKIYFTAPFNKDTINYHYNYVQGKSIYQIDYCDIVADIKKKQEIKARKPVLPIDCDIPLTTQKFSYRDPVSLSKNALERRLMSKQPDNIVQNEKINTILNVTTGESEYMGVIGSLGEFIVTEEMHGKIIHS